MVKIKQSPKLPAVERRSQLLMAAQKLFAQKGYRNTTTNEIAKSANLTKGALYFHFKNKEDILFELIKHVFNHFEKAMNDNVEKLKSPSDFIKICFDIHGKKSAHPDIANNLDFWSQAMAISKIKRYINKSFEGFVEIFAKAIDPKYSKNKKDLNQMAIFTFSLFDGLYVRQLFDPSSVNVNYQLKLLDEMMEARASKIKRGKRKK